MTTNAHIKSRTKKKPSAATAEKASNIEVLQLDWELDSVSSLPILLGLHESSEGCTGVDVVIACDCIYNETLIEPLNTTCAQICSLRTTQSKPTLCLIAQQLRSYEVFESWLKSFHRLFHVWKVPDELLTEPLRENSGFVVHIGIVR